MSDWLTYSPSSGYGNGIITITAATQTELVDRIKTIVAANEDYNLSAETVVRQTVPNKEQYLTFDIIYPGTIYWVGNSGHPNSSIYYKKNDGEWTNLVASPDSSSTIVVTDGDKIYFKGNFTQSTSSSTVHFASSTQFNISGNIMSLIGGDNFSGLTTVYNNVFHHLFTYSPVVDASSLALPATTLAEGCYRGLFYNCYSLTGAPELPATTLANKCYEEMFYYCTSLTTAPELSATTLADYCCARMFESCTSLATAPVLPATTLAPYCYEYMFIDCSGLTTPPALPATTLATNCYESMFCRCVGLTAAPSLPATTMAQSCYQEMFYGCTGLTTAPALPATTLANGCYSMMFCGCKSLTTSPTLQSTNVAAGCYSYMFSGCTSLANIDSILPSSNLSGATGCYRGMFNGCASLTAAPELPATVLEEYCYDTMFGGCTGLTRAPSSIGNSDTKMKKNACQYMFGACSSLTTAPALPSTLLVYDHEYEPGLYVASSCYEGMFNNCTSLTTAPVLPATTLASWCYGHMFYGCTNLLVAPALPATGSSGQYASKCYEYMFANCTSLVVAPELPYIDDIHKTYQYMFSGCSRLNYIKCLALNFNTGDTIGWVDGVADSGTFVKAPEAEWTRGINGIPINWTVTDYSAVVTGISISNLTWTINIPASGGTATSANCTYAVTAYYDDGTTGDVTSQAVVIGSQSVPASQIESAHTAGTLTLTASYNGYSASASTTIYQDAYAPITVTAITLDNLTWVTNIPSEGGIATSANCSFNVIAYYSNSTTGNVTTQATVSGSQSVEASQITSAHTAGTLTLTASYAGYNSSATVIIYQDGYALSITGISFGDLTWVTDVPASGGTATSGNCSYVIIANYNDSTTGDVTSQAVVSGSLSVPHSDNHNRHSVGTLTLTASYSGFTSSSSITVYQAEYPNVLQFNIESGGTIVFSRSQAGAPQNVVQYSFDYGVNWVTITATTEGVALTVAAGDKVLFRGDNNTYSSTDSYYDSFSKSSAVFNLEGNIMGLISSTDFDNTLSLSSDHNFNCMFAGCTGLTSAEKLSLPATTLAINCYRGMFSGCTNMTKTPTVLPATSMRASCYDNMFQNCVMIEKSPEIMAVSSETGIGSQAGNMFNGCSRLNYITCLYTGSTGGLVPPFNDWVSGVSATGTFVKNALMSGWGTGIDGIPTSWSVINYGQLVITGITISNLTWVTNIPASGGTATSANCSYNVFVNFNDGSSADVTSQAVVIGSQNVEASQISTVHTAGTLTLTASYSTFLTSATVTIYQDANQGSLSDYLTFDILTGGRIYFKTNQRTINPTIYYRLNGGSWVSKTPVTGNTSYVTVESGDTIEFKSSFQGGYDNYYCYFSASTGTNFNARGNVMSMVGGDDFSGLTSVGYAVLHELFIGCGGLIDASQLLLPATTLGTSCYAGMFIDCASLTAAPVLPATTLGNNCYSNMFSGCRSLTTAPALPATTLAQNCYEHMFQNCTGLTTAPELPATTLSPYCYRGMFQNCTSLTTAPELSATTLAISCYGSMFYNCSSLNYIKCLATNISANYCTDYWVSGVASTGTFVKDANMTDWSTGTSGIPTNWTVQDAT